MCPFMKMDENWECTCNVPNKGMELDRGNIDTTVHDDCPLKDESINLKYAGEMNIKNPTAFLFHAKKPTFGIGGHPKFIPDNYEFVAEIFKKDVMPDWIFKNTQNIDESWTEIKWPTKNEKIVANFFNLRSTSVGDVIIIKNHSFTGKDMVLRCIDIGWAQVDETEYTCFGCRFANFDEWPTLEKYFGPEAGCDCE